tara:strand:+ start:106 stop:447 length:342 start_codon:yes stop_codon:yes gene_type:complete
MRKKICSLSKNDDFKSILNGEKKVNKYSTIFFKKLKDNDINNLHISFVAKKKLGNAILRNKIKRRLRYIMREAIKSVKINYSYSYLVIAKKIVFNHKFEDIKKELFLNFEKIR